MVGGRYIRDTEGEITKVGKGFSIPRAVTSWDFHTKGYIVKMSNEIIQLEGNTHFPGEMQTIIHGGTGNKVRHGEGTWRQR